MFSDLLHFSCRFSYSCLLGLFLFNCGISLFRHFIFPRVQRWSSESPQLFYFLYCFQNLLNKWYPNKKLYFFASYDLTTCSVFCKGLNSSLWFLELWGILRKWDLPFFSSTNWTRSISKPIKSIASSDEVFLLDIVEKIWIRWIDLSVISIVLLSTLTLACFLPS